MTAVILQPAGDPHAREHYADTIAAPVPQARLGRYLTAEEAANIRDLYGEDGVPTWGVTPGGREVNRGKWDRITPGDVVLMVRDGEVFVSGRVTYKARNKALAEDLWGQDDDGATWEYLYFLDDITSQSMSNADLNAAVGYAANARVQGFNLLDDGKSAALLDVLGIDGHGQPDARAQLRSLVGTTIPTLTGRPNTVTEIRDDNVIVATDRSPGGQPIPIEWIQTAMDRLYRDGEIEISVEAVGHRSAFVGAVLASLPGASTETSPRRVRLPEGLQVRTSVAKWREPPEVEDAIDTIVELAGRGPARRQGRRQSATDRRAIEMLAVERAMAHFEGAGWDVDYVGSVASFDLDCTLGDRRLHVEVKGTSSSGEKVLLTRNEVRHALGTDAEVALFVLHDIQLIEGSEGPEARGGKVRVVHPWILSEDSLVPVGFEHTVPAQDA